MKSDSIREDDGADARRERTELIEQALLTNLIFSLPAKSESSSGNSAPTQISPAPTVHDRHQPSSA